MPLFVFIIVLFFRSVTVMKVTYRSTILSVLLGAWKHLEPNRMFFCEQYCNITMQCCNIVYNNPVKRFVDFSIWTLYPSPPLHNVECKNGIFSKTSLSEPTLFWYRIMISNRRALRDATRAIFFVRMCRSAIFLASRSQPVLY